MRYTSTRDGSISVSFEEAITSGYAADGGLFVPAKLPQIDIETLQLWSKLTYTQLTQSVLRLFVSPDELSDSELASVCRSAFVGFQDANKAVPVIKVGSFFIAELFHGPTFCFKDLGLRAVVNLLSHFATLRNQKVTLLVATTGDTGPAAVQAVSDVENPLLNILVHYPHGQISDFQRKQLTTVQSPCVRVVAFEGGGDDMDLPIKNIITSQQEDGGHMLTGVNSYNIGRPLMQMVHYIWTYFRVVEQLGLEPGHPDVKLDVVLPTGAMGNIAGGYMAKKMGLPLGRLCAGTNINDITYRVIQTGEYHKNETMHKTLSEAINVQLPYNFERLLFYLTDCNHETVKAWMTTIDATSKLDLDETWLKLLQSEFQSARVTDETLCETTRSLVDKFGYVVDPHTAVALSAAEALGYNISNIERKVPVAILATASPCKFQVSVTTALGEEGWKRYQEHDFPSQARHVLDAQEISPHRYPYREGSTLSEAQKEWEGMARAIVDGFVK